MSIETFLLVTCFFLLGVIVGGLGEREKEKVTTKKEQQKRREQMSLYRLLVDKIDNISNKLDKQ